MKPNYFQLLANNIANGELVCLVECGALGKELSEVELGQVKRKAVIVIANVKAKSEAKKVANRCECSGILCKLGDSEKIDNSAFALQPNKLHLIAPKGTWEHKKSGINQVIDDAAITSMVNHFAEQKKDSAFPGILVDFEHSGDSEGGSTLAAGWIDNLVPKPDGLYANIRWSDEGKQKVEGGSYRLVSPSWYRRDLEPVEGMPDNYQRPMVISGLAVTNQPNIPGIPP